MTKKIAHLFCILICLYSSSCSSKKEIEVFGFAYKGEVIIIKKAADTLLNFKVESHADSNSICTFSQKIKFTDNDEQFILKIIVDSNSVNVLDTAINFKKQYKDPFISLVYPLEKKENKRTLFVRDQGDSTYHRY